jgi:hypothetical protein
MIQNNHPRRDPSVWSEENAPRSPSLSDEEEDALLLEDLLQKTEKGSKGELGEQEEEGGPREAPRTPVEIPDAPVAVAHTQRPLWQTQLHTSFPFVLSQISGPFCYLAVAVTLLLQEHVNYRMIISSLRSTQAIREMETFLFELIAHMGVSGNHQEGVFLGASGVTTRFPRSWARSYFAILRKSRETPMTFNGGSTVELLVAAFRVVGIQGKHTSESRTYLRSKTTPKDITTELFVQYTSMVQRTPHFHIFELQLKNECSFASFHDLAEELEGMKIPGRSGRVRPRMQLVCAGFSTRMRLDRVLHAIAVLRNNHDPDGFSMYDPHWSHPISFSKCTSNAVDTYLKHVRHLWVVYRFDDAIDESIIDSAHGMYNHCEYNRDRKTCTKTPFLYNSGDFSKCEEIKGNCHLRNPDGVMGHRQTKMGASWLKSKLEVQYRFPLALRKIWNQSDDHGEHRHKKQKHDESTSIVHIYNRERPCDADCEQIVD